jgi:hypothetical protein
MLCGAIWWHGKLISYYNTRGVTPGPLDTDNRVSCDDFGHCHDEIAVAGVLGKPLGKKTMEESG